MRAVVKAGRLWKVSSENRAGEGVLLSEWEKPGWTYHAKGSNVLQSLIRWTWLLFAIGVWLSPNSSSPPVLTLFGSTNLNSRSAHIDTELSFLMIIPSESVVCESMQGENDAASLALRRKLDSEISGIRSDAVEWQGGSRKVRWTTKLLVWLAKGMLW
jgi:CDP-diacylglycerol---glycerol-3-phosphate 3-phosphatidyltransferase